MRCSSRLSTPGISTWRWSSASFPFFVFLRLIRLNSPLSLSPSSFEPFFIFKIYNPLHASDHSRSCFSPIFLTLSFLSAQLCRWGHVFPLSSLWLLSSTSFPSPFWPAPKQLPAYFHISHLFSSPLEESLSFWFFLFASTRSSRHALFFS
jgi:hypothetical protein